MKTDIEILSKQAYMLYFRLREESRRPGTYSVRRERLVLLASLAYIRFQRRQDLIWFKNRENSPPQLSCQVFRPMKSRLP